MDKRSWPWKKKSSDKQAPEKAAAAASESLAAASELDTALAEKAKQEAIKKPKYVQISMESYTRLTRLEDQVKSFEEQVQCLEDEVKELTEKLSNANTEMTTKENLVKQHAKVAEEAVSGWEKAEAEAATLKNHLESSTLLKLTAEDRASHLDAALKECMRQIRALKEEHEQKLHALSLSKQKLFDKMKLDLESQIADLAQDLARSAAENTALSRSLQEHSNTLVQLSEEKARAEADIEILKSTIESWEKETSSLKYELHIAQKEVEIRNEENNMNVRSAEVANRQHLEGAKKIAKLEAECQRLRSLVRKKLPGPAAMAQMKLEAESLAEPRLRRSPVKLPEFSLDCTQKYLKENEVLTERLLVMEEETKMLKEVLAKRNTELQVSKSVYAQTASRLQNLEAQIQASRAKDGKPSSFTSMSEDGNDDRASFSESWTSTGLASIEVPHLKKEKNVNHLHKPEKSSNHLDLMDDFLEMEKLAYLSNGAGLNSELSDTSISTMPFNLKQVGELSDKTGKNGPEILNNEALVEVPSRIGFEESLQRQPESLVFAELQSKISTVETISQELQTAITQIYNFMTILGNEAKATVPKTTPHGEELNEKLDTFAAKYCEAICGDLHPIDFLMDISSVLNKASELRFNVLGFKGSEVETSSSDCIDKIALPENKPHLNSVEERYSSNGCARFSDSASSPDVFNEGNLVPTSESTRAPWKCSLEEFEQLRVDKENLTSELARSNENFENTKARLLETEWSLSEVRAQLALAEKSNGLAETQLKCMAESYKSLETRADELKIEVSGLRGKIESLERELQEERRRHKEADKRCKDLQQQLERIDCLKAAEDDEKCSQEKEVAAAADKLAECQQTILLLGKQLKALRPQTDTLTPPNNTRRENARLSFQEELAIVTTENMQKTPKSSEIDAFDSTYAPLDSEVGSFMRSPISSKYHKHHPTNSGYSSDSSTPTPEKHARGFTRFFSAKDKN